MRKVLSVILLAVMLMLPFTVKVSAQEEDYYDTTYEDSDYNWDDESWDSEWDSWETTDDYTTTTYDDLGEEEAAAFLAFMAGYAVVMGCFFLVAFIYSGITLSTIAKKVGEDKTWMAWVPVANLFYIYKVAGLSPWLALTMFVPLVNVGFLVYAWMKISERRGFQQWIGILMIVPLVGFLVPAYLAWGNPSGSTSQPVNTPTPEPVKPAEPQK